MITPLVIANWKMQLSLAQAAGDARLIAQGLRGLAGTFVLCPSYLSLAHVKEVLDDSTVMLGAQDAFAEDWGAFTGAVSAAMLKDAGCQFVIIGHSERRRYFGETNEDIGKKMAAVFRHQMTPILCVGETREEKQSGRGHVVIKEQLTRGLADIHDDVSPLIIAYEPVWAIGHIQPAGADDVQVVRSLIKSEVASLLPNRSADSVFLLYGGSVNAANVSHYVGVEKMHGVLVSTASLEADHFLAIVHALIQA